LLASGEDVDWMKLPKPLDDEPSSLPAVSWIDPLDASSANLRVSSASLRPNSPQAAPQKARSGAPALETLPGRFIDSLARRDWQKTGLRLMSQAASAYGTLLAPWRNQARRDRPIASTSPDEPARRPALVPERSAPPEPRPSVEPPLRAPVQAAKGGEQPGVYSPRTSTDDGLPVLHLEPLDDEKGPTDDVLEIDLEPLDDDVPTSRASKPATAAAQASAPLVRERPAPRPLVLPLPQPVNDAHEGVVLRQSASPWTKRLALMGGLVAVGLFAAISSETWVPKAVPSVRIVVSQADVIKQSRERLPHLAPETIRLVLNTSETGVLDAPTVFRVTSDAVDRGSWALSPAEVLELHALRRELLAALQPSEAERVLDYDGTRARRATLPFENRAALDLFARGVRALPSRSRARLQLLLGKAVAAQLRAEGASRP
jgi:hypothetical protein